MRYQDYRDTAHLRENRQDTYYIIPGSTPVIFHDDGGNELYKCVPESSISFKLLIIVSGRVDAWKYNTPMLRRKLYIIEDENGRELFRCVALSPSAGRLLILLLIFTELEALTVAVILLTDILLGHILPIYPKFNISIQSLEGKHLLSHLIPCSPSFPSRLPPSPLSFLSPCHFVG